MSATPIVPRPILARPEDRQTAFSEAPALHPHSSGISWGPVIGGAFVSASLALILLSLGVGLGLSALSPWADSGASASAVGKGAIAWFILTQIVAAALGGYLAGRLRTKWVQIHTDEVYFRDTAHGLLVWALGVVVTVALLASAVTSIVGGGMRSPGNSTEAVADGETSGIRADAYIVDTMFRPSPAGPVSSALVVERNVASDRAEAERIFAHGLKQGALPSQDRTYLGQVVAARAGLSQSDAENRVASAFDEAQYPADNARKALAHLSLWIFVALLSGAFCASFAGTIGGRQRDRVVA
jgi:hypothetical protein